MFTGGTIWKLTHGHLELGREPPAHRGASEEIESDELLCLVPLEAMGMDRVCRHCQLGACQA